MSHPLRKIEGMQLEEIAQQLEKANADLEPEMMSHPDARDRLKLYARIRHLADFGVTALAGKLDDAATLAKTTGTSMGKAKEQVATGRVLGESPELNLALQKGSVSLDQATEIARAEASAPGAATELLKVAKKESFQVLKESARKAKLEAEQHQGLAERQHKARRASNHLDELGMMHLHLAFQPHIGVPIVARAEADAERLAKAAKKAGIKEDFSFHLADAYANLLQGSGKGRAKRPELVVLVSHEVAQRGWTDVRPGEMCKIPGVGPVAPEVAKEIAGDAFLTGVFYDGTDLRNTKRFGRHIPVEVAVALELGEPPDFDGIKCVDCGRRFRNEFDHVEPVVAGGSTDPTNVKPRCRDCHLAKTARDRLAGKLTPKAPPTRSTTRRTRRTSKIAPRAP